jgi:hypothetical protein
MSIFSKDTLPFDRIFVLKTSKIATILSGLTAKKTSMVR